MALETATYLDSLVVTNPAGGDQLSTADDHVRLLKACLKRTFPNIAGEVSASAGGLNQAAIGAVSVSFAASASYALSADFATSADGAVSAQFATSATNATSAVFATSATNASSAVFATNATNAVNATNATSSGFATSANHALSAQGAVSAQFATSATNATSAVFATSATNATSAVYAQNISTQTLKIKAADTSISADISVNKDPHLADWPLSAGCSYAAHGQINFIDGAGGLRFYMFPTGAVTSGQQGAVIYTGVGWGAGQKDYGGGVISQTFDITELSGTVGSSLVFDATWENSVNGALSIWWSQAVSDPAPTTMKKGSWVELRKIDG